MIEKYSQQNPRKNKQKINNKISFTVWVKWLSERLESSKIASRITWLWAKRKIQIHLFHGIDIERELLSDFYQHDDLEYCCDKSMGCPISLKVNFLDLHLDYLPENLVDMSAKQGEKFKQDQRDRTNISRRMECHHVSWLLLNAEKRKGPKKHDG